MPFHIISLGTSFVDLIAHISATKVSFISFDREFNIKKHIKRQNCSEENSYCHLVFFDACNVMEKATFQQDFSAVHTVLS